MGADVPRLAIRRIVGRFTGTRIRMRALPEPGVDEARTVLDVPVLDRGVTGRLDVAAGRVSGKRAECHRRVRWPKGRRADLGDRLLKLLGEKR